MQYRTFFELVICRNHVATAQCLIRAYKLPATRYWMGIVERQQIQPATTDTERQNIISASPGICRISVEERWQILSSHQRVPPTPQVAIRIIRHHPATSPACGYQVAGQWRSSLKLITLCLFNPFGLCTEQLLRFWTGIGQGYAVMRCRWGVQGLRGSALNRRALPRSINTSASCNKKVIATEEKNSYNFYS